MNDTDLQEFWESPWSRWHLMAGGCLSDRVSLSGHICWSTGVPAGGVEPPWALRPTWPSTIRPARNHRDKCGGVAASHAVSWLRRAPRTPKRDAGDAGDATRATAAGAHGVAAESEMMRRLPPESLPGDDRPVAYQCFGCARHFVPKGTPKPFVDGFGRPAVRRDAWQWRECLCDDPDCPANDLVKGMRR